MSCVTHWPSAGYTNSFELSDMKDLFVAVSWIPHHKILSWFSKTFYPLDLHTSPSTLVLYRSSFPSTVFFFLFASSSLPPPHDLRSSPALKPFRWLRSGKHYAGPSASWWARSPPSQASPPSWPRGSWCGQAGRGQWPPPHPVIFAAPRGRQGPVRFGFRLRFATKPKRGVWLAVPRQSLQAKEPLGSIWPIRQ